MSRLASRGAWLTRVPLAIALIVMIAGCRNGERLRLEGTRSPTAGRPLPELELRDLGGQPADLGAFAGRVVVLNLWATWCVPCRDEMPELEALQRKHADDRLTVVGISIDEGDLAPVARFLEAYEISYPNFIADGTTLLEQLDLDPGVPHTLLLDDEGLVRGYWRGRFYPSDASVEALLERVLAGDA